MNTQGIESRPQQAEILSRILLMRGCRFDANSILQRLLIDCDMPLSHQGLADIEASLGLRVPAWTRTFQMLRSMLRLSPKELAPFESRVQSSPGEAGVLLGLLLWENGKVEVLNSLNFRFWPAHCQAIVGGMRLGLGIRKEAITTREGVVALAESHPARLQVTGLSALQLADLVIPAAKKTGLGEKLLQIRGAKKDWKMPKVATAR